MTCIQITPPGGRIRAIDNMEGTFNCTATVTDRLARLTAREKEICVLHFVEGRSQTTVAQWLGISLRIVQRRLTSAITKVPELEPLRTKSLQKPDRPKIFHLSQLKPTDRGPFNADEV